MVAIITGQQSVSEVPEHEELVTRGKRLFTNSKNARQIIEARWQKDNNLYDAKFEPNEIKISETLGIPRLFIGKTYAQIQRILVDVLETFFFDPEELCSISSSKDIPYETNLIVKALMNHRLNGHPINFYMEVYELVLDALKNKTGIFKVYPKLNVKKHSKTVIDDTGSKSVDEYELVNFVPIIECVPYEDIFFSTSATWKDYYRHPIIHRIKRSRDYFKRRGYKNVDEVQGSSGSDFTDPVKTQRLENQQSPFFDSTVHDDLEEIYAFEIWDFKIGKSGYLESGSYILGGGPDDPSVLFRGWEWNNLPYKFDEFEPNRHPFIAAQAFPESHAMNGKSFPEVTEGLQKETNAQRNQEREAVAKALRPPTLVNKNAGVDLIALMQRKTNSIIQAEDTSAEAVRELGSLNPIPISAPAQARTDADYAEISSISPNQLGAPSDQNQTATAFAGLDRNANKKIQMVVRNIAISGIIPALKYLLRLEQQYESNEYIELVTGKSLGKTFLKDNEGQYVGFSPKTVIAGDFDFTVNIGVNKASQANQWRTLIELGNQANASMGQLVQFGVVDPQEVQYFNPMWAFKQIANVMGQKNVNEMSLQAVPPPPQQQEQPQGMASQPNISQPNQTEPISVLA